MTRQRRRKELRSDFIRHVLVLVLETPSERICLDPSKVITLGVGELGWVDLRKGILLRNVFDQSPVACSMPLPLLLPATANQGNYRLYSPQAIRDVICTDGLIKQ